MSDDDDDRTCRYGTALPELPADVIPTKKPITIADQIAVDANGKRRFHGAFTGGFSAGFWNTVGSLEGWKPQAFKSSRSEKAQRLTQAPTDFMDDEDKGEFGIAPQRIQTTDDFTAPAPDKDSRKRPAVREDGPVLGTPVLQLFLKPAKDKASVSLLKKMGWREQQGIGSRLTKREKKKAAELYLKERGGAKVYNCDMGPFQKAMEESDEEEPDEASSSDDSDAEITFAPDDYEPFLHAFKTNRFGLGYEGLNKTSVAVQSQHINLFAPFEVLDRKNKKLSITGQAFGVGAFEEDDDDIYARDDMTAYDFSLDEKAKKEKKRLAQAQNSNIIDGFAVSKSQQKRMNKKIYFVDVPTSFTPRNWAMRKTRFGPAVVPPNSSPMDEGHKRHMLTAEERGQLLNDKTEPKKQPQASNTDEQATTTSPLDIIIKTEPDVVISAPIPERKALNFIKLPESLNFDRFVSEKDLAVVKEEKVKVEPKKFEVRRTKTVWQPCSLLYEKMNIAEPSGGSRRKGNKGTSNFSLFQCLNETTKSRKKTYRERLDITEVFTKAQEADVEVPNTNAKIISRSSSQSTSKSTSESRTLSAPTIIQPSPPVPTKLITPKVTSKVVENSAVKKTDLEMKSLLLETKHPSEKKDLFKAIFDSDDEEETTDELKSSENITPQTSSQQAIPLRNDFLPKPATILNVLRNTSPPRGIFSNMFKPTTEKVEKAPETESTTKNVLEEKINVNDPAALLYGPSLPSVTPATVTSTPLISELPPTISKEKSRFVADEWIEKSKIVDKDLKKKDRKKHRKDKKHKRDKEKKKKNKKDKS